jgi:hypothetical protein
MRPRSRLYRCLFAGLPALAVLVLARPATAAPAFGTNGSVAEDDEDAPRPLPTVGLMFDVGTLDGAMLSLVYRPAPWVRLNGGVGTNSASAGFRVGAIAVPFSSWQAISIEGGRFVEGDVNGIVRAVSGYEGSRALERFDYNFLNLQLGAEVERSDLLFFARAGLGLLWTTLPVEQAAAESATDVVDSDGSVHVFMPTLKLGFVGFL